VGNAALLIPRGDPGSADISRGTSELLSLCGLQAMQTPRGKLESSRTWATQPCCHCTTIPVPA